MINVDKQPTKNGNGRTPVVITEFSIPVSTRPDPQKELVYVTPALAKKWLDSARVDRAVKHENVNMIIRALEAGTFDGASSNDSVCFDYEGYRINGLHRLTAIYKSGIGTQLWIMTGVNPDAVKHMDSGSGRSVRDNLGMEGRPNARHCASSANAIVFLLLNKLTKLSQSEVENLVDSIPAFDKVVDACKGNDLTKWSPFLAVMALTSVDEEDSTLQFIELVKTGSAPNTADPSRVLRERLIGRVKELGKRNRRTWMLTILKAYNLWATNKPVRRLEAASEKDVGVLLANVEGLVQLPNL